MKHIARLAAGMLALTLTLTACGGLNNAVELGAPKKAEPLSWSETTAMDPALGDAAKQFAAEFSAEAVKGLTENTAVSPISVYFALGLAAECAAGATREELLSAMKTDYNTLKNGYSDLYRSLIEEYKTNTGSIAGRLEFGNSIWLQEGVSFKDECIKTLSDDYFCYSYAADFMGENKKANDAVRDFVKQQSRDLIDKDFLLPEETVFTLINTLYLKDVWNLYGDDLPFAAGEYTFTQTDGQTKSVRLLQGYYTFGRAYEEETFTHYHTDTYHGYRLKFLLPKDGHTAEEIFTAENLALINEMTDYRVRDDENMIEYHTRCLFPEYRASYDEDIRSILQKFGIYKLFSEEECELTNLTDTKVRCEGVQHAAALNVNRKGIEGAAVTVIPGAGAPGPSEYTVVEQDFVLDRAFGYLVTDPYGNVLFSGIVNEL